jgi:hypothetical protein
VDAGPGDGLLDSLIHVSTEPATIGQVGDAPDEAVVVFRALQSNGVGLAGVEVTVESSAPFVSIVEPYQQLTDGNGDAVITLSAITAGPIVLSATANQDLTTRQVNSPPIVVLPSPPVPEQSFIVCGGETELHVSGTIASVQCTVTLIDRFSNPVPDVMVQLRGENLSLPPFALSDWQGQVVFDAVPFLPTAPAALLGADGRTWSYGNELPINLVDVADPGDPDHGANDFTAAGCFDADVTTGCNLIALCANGTQDTACPLPSLDSGAGCWEDLSLRALLPLPGDPEMSVANYVFDDPVVVAAVDAYRADLFRCGWKTSCLLGTPDGLDWDTGDDCLIPPGCLDFSVETPCAHEHMATVLAIFEGAEAFVDANGNGRYDPGEAFTDAVDPIVDKQDNGSFDDFNGADLVDDLYEVPFTDFFLDEDFNGVWSSTGNGAWDASTTTFVMGHTYLPPPGTTHVLAGQPCAAADIGNTVACEVAALGDALCEELVPGVGFQPACLTAPVGAADEGERVRVRAISIDDEGRCASAGLGSRVEVQSDGPWEASDDSLLLSAANCTTAGPADPGVPWRRLPPRFRDEPPVFDGYADVDCGPQVLEALPDAPLEIRAGTGLASLPVQADCSVTYLRAYNVFSDRGCTACHTSLDPQGGLSLTGCIDALFVDGTYQAAGIDPGDIERDGKCVHFHLTEQAVPVDPAYAGVYRVSVASPAESMVFAYPQCGPSACAGITHPVTDWVDVADDLAYAQLHRWIEGGALDD